MKQFILLLSFVFATCFAQGQTIDTSIHHIAAVKLVPFKAKFTDTANVTHLGMRIIGDDMRSSCTFYYVLLMNDGATESVNGNFTLCCEDYEAWSGDNSFPFQYIATKLGLTFKND